MSLKNVPLEELQAELQRRGATAGVPHPVLSTKPDFTELVKLCKQYMEYVDSDQYKDDDDWREYIYEAALTALYGKNVFPYINSKL